MPVGELIRMIRAANEILEKASKAVDLSTRATFALLMMSVESGGSSVFSNGWLKKQFLEFRISTPPSVQKDASSAKTELQEKGNIQVGLRPKEFSITGSGRAKVKVVHETLEKSIEEYDLPQPTRKMIRELVGLPEPESAESSDRDASAARKKPPTRDPNKAAVTLRKGKP
jgi:hypothetical protein